MLSLNSMRNQGVTNAKTRRDVHRAGQNQALRAAGFLSVLFLAYPDVLA